jgi:PAS domain S-box-containing protein
MIYVSPSYERLWGRTCESLYESPMSFMEAVHPEDRHLVAASVVEHVEGHWDLEYRIVQPDGTVRWIKDRGFPIRDELGNLQLMTGIARDITDRKEAEEALRKAKDELELKVQERTARLEVLNENLLREIVERKRAEEGLRESEEKYRSVFDNAAVGINVKLPDGTFLEVNQAMIDLLGYSREELRRLSYLDITHPDDVKLSEEMHAALERGEIDTYRIEKRYIGKDGRVIWIDTSVKALRDPSRNLRGTVGIVVDITERKEAEEALRKSEEFNRRLVDDAPFGIIHVAADGTIEYVNPAANRIGGIPEGQMSPVLGKNILELPGLQGRPEAKEGFLRLLEGRSVSELEVPYKTSMGRDTVLLVGVTPRFAADGAVAGGILMFTDISERKRAQELQNETARYRAVADLAGGVAHNFNNLLQVVIGNLELALMDLEAGDYELVRDGLEKVLKSSQFGAEIVRRLQSFSRRRQIFPEYEKRVFDVSDVAKQAVEVSQSWLTSGEKEGRKVFLHTRLKEGCLVNADKNEIFGVIVNLVRNAVEALPAGGDVDLTTAVDADKVVLQVRDTGVGISQENLGRVFNPFFTTKVEPGAGLSLASGRNVVEDCGGEIHLDSVEGQGTTVTVLLPLAEKMPEPTKALPERGTEPRLTVLVIDDMEAITDLMKSALTEYGHAVLRALSGEEGIEIFKENPADVVICDLAMPGMTGWEVGKRISAICQEWGVPKTPFILLTGWSGQELETEKIAQSGVDAVVGKPLRIQNILEVMREVIVKSLCA